jgi:hypothetical protein
MSARAGGGWRPTEAALLKHLLMGIGGSQTHIRIVSDCPRHLTERPQFTPAHAEAVSLPSGSRPKLSTCDGRESQMTVCVAVCVHDRIVFAAPSPGTSNMLAAAWA